MVISMAIGQSTHQEADAVIFTTEGDTKSWHGRAVKSTNQRKCLLVTGVTTGKFQQIFQNGTAIPG